MLGSSFSLLCDNVPNKTVFVILGPRLSVTICVPISIMKADKALRPIFWVVEKRECRLHGKRWKSFEGWAKHYLLQDGRIVIQEYLARLKRRTNHRSNSSIDRDAYDYYADLSVLPLICFVLLKRAWFKDCASHANSGMVQRVAVLQLLAPPLELGLFVGATSAKNWHHLCDLSSITIYFDSLSGFSGQSTCSSSIYLGACVSGTQHPLAHDYFAAANTRVRVILAFLTFPVYQCIFSVANWSVEPCISGSFQHFSFW
jgi:hypothetical protein